jgi:hypothetical protein
VTSPLVVVLWSMFGARRLYVDTADRRHVGWVDLNTGHRSLVMPELESAFDAAVADADAHDTPTPRRALEAAIESALVEGLAGQDRPEAEPTPGLRVEPMADVVADPVDEEGWALRHAYRGQQAFSDWDVSARGARLAADEADRPSVARWAYQSAALAVQAAEVTHLFA